MKYFRLLHLFIIVCSFQGLLGQYDCSNILTEARARYQAGIVEEVPAMLKECLASGFLKEEKKEAYKLVINSYLFDGFPDRADSVMKSFLREFPGYVPVEEDIVEFRQLMGTYQTGPWYSAGVRVGGNLSLPVLLEPYGTAAPLTDNGEYQPAGMGFQAAVQWHIKLFYNAELGIELQFMRNLFSHNAEPYSFTRYEYHERQTHLTLPVSFIYLLGANRLIKPYLRIGAGPDFLISAGADASRYYTETGDVVFKDISIPATDVTDLRTRFNGWAFAGGGVRLKLSKSCVFLDARYAVGMLPANDGGNRYAVPDLNWLIYYTDNDFRMSGVSFSVGYARNFYNPKKR